MKNAYINSISPPVNLSRKRRRDTRKRMLIGCILIPRSVLILVRGLKTRARDARGGTIEDASARRMENELKSLIRE